VVYVAVDFKQNVLQVLFYVDCEQMPVMIMRTLRTFIICLNMNRAVKEVHLCCCLSHFLTPALILLIKEGKGI